MTTTFPIATPSIYADWIDAKAAAPSIKIRLSTLGHREAIDELLDLRKECSQPNWDGYHALAVEDATIATTHQLLQSLPLGFPRPSLGAEPDGHVTLEWYKSPSRTLSISVDPEGFLHFAGLFGHSKRYGTLEFLGTVPAELIQLVQEL